MQQMELMVYYEQLFIELITQKTGQQNILKQIKEKDNKTKTENSIRKMRYRSKISQMCYAVLERGERKWAKTVFKLIMVRTISLKLKDIKPQKCDVP